MDWYINFIANGIYHIKIDFRYSQKKIEFLDTWVKLEKGNEYTDLYKPTDKQLLSYLQRSSCHPFHNKTGLAYGLGLKIRREQEADLYQRQRGELKSQLRKRGYARKFVEQQLQTVDDLDMESLLKTSRPKASKNLQTEPFFFHTCMHAYMQFMYVCVSVCVSVLYIVSIYC